MGLRQNMAATKSPGCVSKIDRQAGGKRAGGKGEEGACKKAKNSKHFHPNKHDKSTFLERDAKSITIPNLAIQKKVKRKSKKEKGLEKTWMDPTSTRRLEEWGNKTVTETCAKTGLPLQYNLREGTIQKPGENRVPQRGRNVWSGKGPHWRDAGYRDETTGCGEGVV